MNLTHIINTLKNTKYNTNTFTHKNHENTIENIFIQLGLNSNQSENNHYIKEPNGSQAPPDFRIVLDNITLDIECKSSQTSYKPMWNSTYPSKDTLYVFTNKKDNQTLVIKGDTIVTPHVENIFLNYKKANKELHDHYNLLLSQLSISENPYGMRVYPRNMFVQTLHLDKNQKDHYLEKIFNSLQ